MARAEPFLAGELHLTAKLLGSVFICNSSDYGFSKARVIFFYMLSILNLSNNCVIEILRVVRNSSIRHFINISTKKKIVGKELVINKSRTLKSVYLNATLWKQKIR